MTEYESRDVTARRARYLQHRDVAARMAFDAIDNEARKYWHERWNQYTRRLHNLPNVVVSLPQ